MVVSLAAAAARVLSLGLNGLEDFEQEWFGQRFSGPAALAAFVPRLAVYLGGAWGLWHRRPWARLVAIGYLGYLLASFTIWGVRDFQAQGLAWLLLWYAFLLPFCCFSLGFLYRGKRYFDQGRPRVPR